MRSELIVLGASLQLSRGKQIGRRGIITEEDDATKGDSERRHNPDRERRPAHRLTNKAKHGCPDAPPRLADIT